jgi:hypothetical protein
LADWPLLIFRLTIHNSQTHPGQIRHHDVFRTP